MWTASLNTVEQALTEIDRLREKWGPLALRGQRRDWQLVPSLYRIDPVRDEDHGELEADIVRAFQQRALPHLEPRPTNWIEWVSIMQHHGVPTRLLDWTRSPLVALYFALHSAGTEDLPTIWIVGWKPFNEVTANKLSPGASPMDALQQHVVQYEVQYTSLPRERRPKPPVMIGVPHAHPRLTSQQGAFMLFGSDREALYRNEYNECLAKITLNPGSNERNRQTLYNWGLTETSIFPDLDHLGLQIRRELSRPRDEAK